jgi:hypothetical protein
MHGWDYQNEYKNVTILIPGAEERNEKETFVFCVGGVGRYDYHGAY